MVDGTDRPAQRPDIAESGEPARVRLPEWMRDPTTGPVPILRRWSIWLDNRPRLRRAREAWWRWRDRSDWTNRDPRAAEVLSFIVFAIVAAILVGGIIYVFVFSSLRIRVDDYSSPEQPKRPASLSTDGADHRPAAATQSQ